jgi:hypothetical protein
LSGVSTIALHLLTAEAPEHDATAFGLERVAGSPAGTTPKDPLVGDDSSAPAQWAVTVRYEIRVEGILDEQWSAWFDGMQITSEPDGVTMIAGPVTDQAALHGLLAKVRDLCLPLISVRRLDP